MDRTFHNVTGHVTYSDSGIFTLPFDRSGLSYVKPLVPALSHSATVKCDDVPYCGWPYYLPVIRFTHLEYASCFYYGTTYCMQVHCMQRQFCLYS